jgi:hypothetical protein
MCKLGGVDSSLQKLGDVSFNHDFMSEHESRGEIISSQAKPGKQVQHQSINAQISENPV